MREIKFRGKSIMTGEWVYGSLIQEDKWAFIRNLDKNGIRNIYQVDPETVGQYTGLKDKSGTEIFEVDFLQDRDIITQVVFRDSEWQEKLISSPKNHLRDYFPFSNEISLATTVIGNIYDNPELLETKE
ncbi:YopX family protein [Bacillus sp. JJ722]|uniref:YopX family protein n=1 Tax=Bacillus sp. JJ722 TaxID=3122973 RepID=UPI002FFE7531